MLCVQRQLTLPSQRRGWHLITREIVAAVPELARCSAGLLHIFLQHPSASLAVNENADPDVARDLGDAFDRLAPEGFPYAHSCEGPDDMPAHIKTALLGCSLTLPVSEGRLALGTWQGIYLCEHRDRATPRSLLLTLQGVDNATC